MKSRTLHALWILPALALVAAPALAQPPSTAKAGEPAPFGWEHFAQRHDVNGDGVVTKEELLQTSDLFSRLDANGDGVLTEADFAALRQDRLAAHLLRRADENHDGLVTQAEWQSFTAARAAWEPPGIDLQALFSAYDKDGDGTVALADLPAAGFGERMGAGMWRGSHRRFGAELMKRLDTDGDGRVSLDEWLAGAQTRPGFDPQRAEAIFKALDTNGDGYLSADDRPAGRGPGPRGRR